MPGRWGLSGGEDSHGVVNRAWLYDLGTEFSLQAGRDRHFAESMILSFLLRCLPETAPARNQRPPDKEGQAARTGPNLYFAYCLSRRNEARPGGRRCGSSLNPTPNTESGSGERPPL